MMDCRSNRLREDGGVWKWLTIALSAAGGRAFGKITCGRTWTFRPRRGDCNPSLPTLSLDATTGIVEALPSRRRQPLRRLNPHRAASCPGGRKGLLAIVHAHRLPKYSLALSHARINAKRRVTR